MNELETRLFAQAMTECMHSSHGCKKLPVRMIVEMGTDGEVDAEIVLLCKDHASTYQPEGTVLSDEMIVPDKHMHLM